MAPLQRLATGLDDEALLSERFAQLQKRDPAELREAARHARDAVPPCAGRAEILAWLRKTLDALRVSRGVDSVRRSAVA